MREASEASIVAEIINSGPKLSSISDDNVIVRTQRSRQLQQPRPIIITRPHHHYHHRHHHQRHHQRHQHWHVCCEPEFINMDNSFSTFPFQLPSLFETFICSDRTLEKTSIHFVCNLQQQFSLSDGYDKFAKLIDFKEKVANRRSNKSYSRAPPANINLWMR